MKISSIGAKLLISEDGSSYAKYTDIKSIPDLGGDPEQIDVTCLEDEVTKYINGVQSQESMAFESDCDNDLANYEAMEDLADRELFYQIVLGRSGKSAFFKGQHKVRLNGAGVNESLSMTTTVAPSTKIELKNTIAES